MAQITTIVSTDLISSSRTTINNNFSWLNSNKVTYRGAYSAVVAYGLSDMVVSGNGVYVGLQVANTGNAPAGSPTWWGVVASFESPLTFSAPLTRAVNTVALSTVGSGGSIPMAPSLGTPGNCVQWDSTGVTDAGAPCGSGSGSSPGYTVVPYSTTPVFTASSASGNSFLIVLTGDVSSSTLTGATTGQILLFTACQNSAGGHVFVWPANVLGAATISSTASACTNQVFIFNGTEAVAMAPAYVTGVAGGSIVLPGSTSGLATIQPPAVAGSAVLILPGTSGTLVRTLDNVATATALAATPTKCSAGQYPLGVDASGNAQNCTTAASGSTGVPRLLTRRWSTILYSGSGTTINNVGTNATAAGTVTAGTVDTNWGSNANIASAATTDNKAELNTSGGWQRQGRNLLFQARVGVHEVTGTHRLFAGLLDNSSNSTTVTGTDSPGPPYNVMGFSFSVGRSANWYCYSGSNSAVDVVDSGVVVTADMPYDLQVVNDDTAGTVTYSINGSTVCATATHRPAAAMPMNSIVSLRTLENVAKNLRVGGIYLESDR